MLGTSLINWESLLRSLQSPTLQQENVQFFMRYLQQEECQKWAVIFFKFEVNYAYCYDIYIYFKHHTHIWKKVRSSKFSCWEWVVIEIHCFLSYKVLVILTVQRFLERVKQIWESWLLQCWHHWLKNDADDAEVIEKSVQSMIYTHTTLCMLPIVEL